MLSAIQGEPGSGKSYFAVNRLMVDYLQNSERPIATTVELNVAEFTLFAAKGKQALAQKYASRIRLLKNRESMAYGENGEELGEHHERKEFWYFTETNTVFLLDEAAEVFNAQNWKDRPESLVTYINQHRHYKDDLFFFCQAISDLDAQLRRKIAYVWDIRNSLKEPIFGDHIAVAGYKHFIQFFMCRCYKGRDLQDKTTGDVTKKGAQQLEYVRVRPTRRGFANYNSFSKSQLMPWKKAASADAKSADVGVTVWEQLRGGIGGTVLWGGSVVVVLIGVFVGFTSLMAVVEHAEEGATLAVGDVTAETALEAAVAVPEEEEEGEAREEGEAELEPEPEPEAEPAPKSPDPLGVRYVSSVKITLTDGRTYKRGQYIDYQGLTEKIDGIGKDGVFLTSGWVDHNTFAASAGRILLFGPVQLATGK